MSQILQIFNRIAPIIFLLAIGKWIQKKAFLSGDTISEIKKFVVNFSLPAVLFISFLYVDLQPAYIWFLPIMLGLCALLYLLGTVLHTQLKVKGEYFPFLITGFEFGMIGVSLFGAAYGMDKLGKIAIIDFGQEMFIWFIYTSLLAMKREGNTNLKELVKIFATSPPIIAILLGITLNLFGIPKLLDDIILTEGLLAAVELIGGLTVPLILIVVGYGIKIDKQVFAYSARVILIRLMVNIPAALLLNHFVIGGLLGLDKGFQAAFFTLLILPPPYILTLLMKQDLVAEGHSVDNTLTLHTLVTIIVFIIYYAFNPVI